VLAAPGEALPDWQIICKLSALFGRPMHYEGPAEIMDEIALATPIYGGVHHHRLAPNGLQWPCPNGEHPGTPFLHREKFTRGLGRFHPVDFIPPAELPDRDYPFILSTGRILYHYHTGTMSRRVDALNAYVREGYAEIHPDDAKRLELRTAASCATTVEARSPRGFATTRGAVRFIPLHFARRRPTG
jgi:predicted molibdopterin-dependent oxidoreductase YjgC